MEQQEVDLRQELADIWQRIEDIENNRIDGRYILRCLWQQVRAFCNEVGPVLVVIWMVLIAWLLWPRG